MYYELMDPCVHGMVKWQHRGVTYRDPEIEHAEPLSSLGLSSAGDDPADEYIPTGADGLEVDDIIGDVIQSQESAGSLHSRRKRKRRRRGDPVASYSAQQMLFEDSKTMSFT
ncbi:hypothetical protein F511_17751 [Dorcoceras hygrometricum]|uniref:Uncharacterized protein n=1 Tax=Dorcoceras hygrometricum TaxID=472368 RepID=A0A2Z7AZW4_9LAMI|nr:hypothetical protein F511_17751 [Dorcoceras hygrometricum]